MSKVQLTRAQVEMAQKLGLVKFENGKMFLMNNTPQQVQWSQHNPAAQWGQSLVTLVAPKLQEVAKAVRAEERFTLDDMKGQVFTKVYVTDNKYEMIFENDEFIFTFYHEDDCCESVYIDDITGDLNDLVGKPLDIVEVARHEDTMPQGMDLKKPEDSFTWTFYKFATIKGWVDVRWLGDSNGYYSEEVDFKGERK
jgi:hypothetical protein